MIHVKVILTLLGLAGIAYVAAAWPPLFLLIMGVAIVAALYFLLYAMYENI